MDRAHTTRSKHRIYTPSLAWGGLVATVKHHFISFVHCDCPKSCVVHVVAMIKLPVFPGPGTPV